MLKILFIFAISIFLLIISILLILRYKIIKSSENMKNENLKKLVILGARVGSKTYDNRLENIKDFKKIDQILVTGTKEECQYAKSIMLNKNVIYDDLALNTYTNIKNNLNFIDQQTVITTNLFHYFRVRLICKHFKLEPTIYINDHSFYYKAYIREFFAILKYFVYRCF